MAKEESSFTAMRLAESQSGLIAALLLTEGFGRQHPLTLAPGPSGDWDAKKTPRKLPWRLGRFEIGVSAADAAIRDFGEVIHRCVARRSSYATHCWQGTHPGEVILWIAASPLLCARWIGLGRSGIDDLGETKYSSMVRIVTG
jgi:hypothetical protein